MIRIRSGASRSSWRRGTVTKEPPPTARMLWGGLARFAVAVLGIVAAAVVLAAAGMTIVAIVALFLAGVPIGVLAAGRLVALRFPAILLCAGLGAFSVWAIEDPPFGQIASGTPRPIMEAPLVGAYRDHGLRAARELASDTPIMARQRTVGTMTLAPLVGVDWKADQPVANWVVGYAFRSGIVGSRHPDHWAAPGELVRLIGRDTPQILDFAMVRALQHHDLRAADEIALFTWRASAADAMAAQATRLLILMAIVMGLWALCVGLLAWGAARRRAAGA